MGTVRITSGIYKNRKLLTPGEGTHPMGERERIALFNTLVQLIPEALVIDSYSGSGALGFEALSRGAKKVIFIEKSSSATRTIKDNCKTLGLNNESIVVFRNTVAEFSKSQQGLQADIVFADPPYDNFNPAEVNLLVKFLSPAGTLALSHPDEPPVLAGLELIKTQKYSGARLSIYKRTNHE